MDKKLSVEQTVNDCYEQYYQSLYKYCRVRLGEFSEHAEDCVQDAFMHSEKQ